MKLSLNFDEIYNMTSLASKEGSLDRPIVIDLNFKLLDGFKQYWIVKHLGWKYVPVKVI